MELNNNQISEQTEPEQVEGSAEAVPQASDEVVSQPEPQPQPVSQPGPNTPPANYPPYYGYQMPYNYRPQPQPYRYVRPAPTSFPPKNEDAGTKGHTTPVWKRLLSVASVLAIVVCSCVITGSVVERKIGKKYENQTLYYNDKINVLQQQLQENTDRSNQKLDELQGQIMGGTSVSGMLTPAQVYAQNVGSVVAINCTASVGMGTTAVSSGSGFVLTEDGYIVSNYHVVDGATGLTVVFSDGKEYTASYIGGDEANDIALIKINASGLRPVTIGRSDELIVGDQVAAIGNPLGELASTLTVGFVSAKDRVIVSEGSQINMMQTDAAINPGNSGGPLFNMDGEVVGITTAKYSGTTSSGASIEGIGFAIPMDDVYEMLIDLKDHGYITGAYLGVSVSNVEVSTAQMYGLPMGVLVHEVTSGSCAMKAGVQIQDIIVELGGRDIENMNDLTRALRKVKAGETVSMVVYRHSQGGEVILTVTLDEKPRPEKETVAPSVGSADDWFDEFFGG